MTVDADSMGPITRFEASGLCYLSHRFVWCAGAYTRTTRDLVLRDLAEALEDGLLHILLRLPFNGFLSSAGALGPLGAPRASLPTPSPCPGSLPAA